MSDEMNNEQQCKFSINKNCIKKFVAVIVIILLAAAFCFKYEITSTSEGIYRINKITGNVQQITGTRFIPVDKMSMAEKYGGSKFRVMDEVTAKNSIKCNLSIMWRNNQLYYKFTASPFTYEMKKIRDSYYSSGKGFTIQLYDKHGFVITEIHTNISSMTAMVNDSNDIYQLEQKAKTYLTYEEAKDIASWAVTWNF